MTSILSSTRIASTVFTALLLTAGSTSQVSLSRYLGAPTGTATSASNAPFTTIVSTSQWKIGVDCPGSWTSRRITLKGLGAFEQGVGMHPTQGGSTEVRFHLEAIANSLGQKPTRFTSTVGIDTFWNGHEGARFEVLLDGALVESKVVLSMNSPSLSIDVPLGAARTLTLRTVYVGAWNTNHACWADAKLTVPWNARATPATVKPGDSFALEASQGLPNGVSMLVVSSVNRVTIPSLQLLVVPLNASGAAGLSLRVPPGQPAITVGFEYWTLNSSFGVVKSNEALVKI